jgi:hypothetical protein
MNAGAATLSPPPPVFGRTISRPGSIWASATTTRAWLRDSQRRRRLHQAHQGGQHDQQQRTPHHAAAGLQTTAAGCANMEPKSFSSVGCQSLSFSASMSRVASISAPVGGWRSSILQGSGALPSRASGVLGEVDGDVEARIIDPVDELRGERVERLGQRHGEVHLEDSVAVDHAVFGHVPVSNRRVAGARLDEIVVVLQCDQVLARQREKLSGRMEAVTVLIEALDGHFAVPLVEVPLDVDGGDPALVVEHDVGARLDPGMRMRRRLVGERGTCQRDSASSAEQSSAGYPLADRDPILVQAG